MKEKLSAFVEKVKIAKNNIINEYSLSNNGIEPHINDNGFLVAPHDNYKVPPLKFVIGLPMAFKSGEIIPFIRVKEDKNNSILNKVTDKDLNIFEKVKIRLDDLKSVEKEELSSVGIIFNHGKIWRESDYDCCYLYISGSVSLKTKKDLAKIMIEKVETKKIKIKKGVSYEGKLSVEARLISYTVEERKISDQKTEKRYVGIFNTKDHGKITGTVAKKLVDLYDGNLNKMLGKNIRFTASFKKGNYGDLIRYSHPVNAEII